MGGDGGSIPLRADMIRTKGMKFKRNLGGMGYNPNTQIRADDERLSQQEEREFRWHNCAMTQEPLRKPLVVCRLGRIYNKDAVLEALLHKAVPAGCHHIRSLRDVKNISVEFAPDNKTLFCAVSRNNFDGTLKGVVLWSCGCVVSEKAFKNVKSEEATSCIVCSKPYSKSDVIPLIPDSDQLKNLEDKILAEQFGRPTEESKTTKRRKRLEPVEGDGMDKNSGCHITDGVPNSKDFATVDNEEPDADRVKFFTRKVLEQQSKIPKVKESEKSNIYRNLFHK